jgi:uncharacterized protein (DUF1330 family)
MNTSEISKSQSSEPKGYVLAVVHVTDPEAYERYRQASAIVASQFGGAPIVRGGSPMWMEGAVKSERVVLLEFPSRALAQAYATSPEYQEARKHRDKAAEVIYAVLSGA